MQALLASHSSGDFFADRHESDQIDKTTLEIAQADDATYNNIKDLADELPDHSPRYILLSYPLTLVCISCRHSLH